MSAKWKRGQGKESKVSHMRGVWVWQMNVWEQRWWEREGPR